MAEQKSSFVSIGSKLVSLFLKLLLLTVGLILSIILLISSLTFQSAIKKRVLTERENLVSKGRIFLSNTAIALNNMVPDNAFTDIKELIVSTVQNDSDVVYGTYCDNNLRSWVFYKKDDLGDLPVNLEGFNFTDSISKCVILMPSDSILEYNVGDKNHIMEFIKPLYIDGEKTGVVRFGISTQRLDEAVAVLRKESNVTLLKLLVSIVLVSLLIGYISFSQMRKSAMSLTTPIKSLNDSAGHITQGNYDEEVTVSSNDEIGMLAENFEKMRVTVKQYTENLEKMVEERTEQLKVAQRELVEKAHKAGMADIATGTLHNVGNILNSVKTSVQIMDALLQRPQYKSLQEANALLKQNIDDLDNFILNNPKGKKLMKYYLLLEDGFVEESKNFSMHIKRLNEKVEMIADVIATQQTYAGKSTMSEKYSLTEIVNDALKMQAGTIGKYGITLKKEFNKVQDVYLQKTKLIHVLINLINNAKDAMLSKPEGERILEIKIYEKDGNNYVSLKDRGEGIPKESLDKIFTHGYTTKEKGHGFGLHSSANYMVEMNGHLSVMSEGVGKGAEFILEFPVS